jgi:EmrB/QacA subfamily drug resistance transporter
MKKKEQFILLIACTAVFIEALDIAILNIAFPLIKTHFHHSAETLQWLQTIYVLFYGGFLILGGKLADAFGHKKFFLLGSFFFLIASVGAGFSTSFLGLLCFRALQGLAAALAIPASVAIIRNTFEQEEQKNKALGLFSSFAGVGSGIGLALGGIIATYLGWQWVFFINIPIVSAVVLLGFYFIPADSNKKLISSSDFILGIILTIVAILSSYFIHDLPQIEQHTTRLLVMLGIILAGCALFFYYNHKAASPLIDIKLFRYGKTALGNINTFLLGAIFFSYLVLFPLYVQQYLQFTAAETGMILFPFSFLSALTAKFIIPRLFKTFGIMNTGIIGMGLLFGGATFFAIAIIGNFPYALLFLSLVCMSGLGIAVSYPSLAVMALQDIPEEQQGLGAGVNQTAYFLGAGFGLSLVSLVMQFVASAQYFKPTTNVTLWPVLLLMLLSFLALIRIVRYKRKDAKAAYSY